MATANVFGARLSPFVEKVVRGLELKGIDYEITGIKGPGDLRRNNPTTGKMPVVTIGTERIYDSTFILRRLDELYPQPALQSSEPAVAAAQRQLEDWSDESLYWYLMALRWTERNTEATLREVLEGLPLPVRLVDKGRLRRKIGPMAQVQGLGRLPYEVLVAELERRLDDLESQLGERSFFYADQPSVADLAVYGVLLALQRPATPEGAGMVARRPRLAAMMARLEQECERRRAGAANAA